MEGTSRHGGRSSSRYGSAPAVFTGPVRKWKKEWVHVAPRPPPNPNKARKDTCRLVLCKWTPAASTSTHTPRRRFRYNPVADVLMSKTESKDKKNNVVTSEEPQSNVGDATMPGDVYEKLEMFDASVRDTQPTLSSIFGEDDDDARDLDLGGMAGNDDAVKENKTTRVEAANSGAIARHLLKRHIKHIITRSVKGKLTSKIHPRHGKHKTKATFKKKSPPRKKNMFGICYSKCVAMKCYDDEERTDACKTMCMTKCRTRSRR